MRFRLTHGDIWTLKVMFLVARDCFPKQKAESDGIYCCSLLATFLMHRQGTPFSTIVFPRVLRARKRRSHNVQ